MKALEHLICFINPASVPLKIEGHTDVRWFEGMDIASDPPIFNCNDSQDKVCRIILLTKTLFTFPLHSNDYQKSIYVKNIHFQFWKCISFTKNL